MTGLPRRPDFELGEDLVPVRRAKPRVRKLDHGGRAFIVKDIAHCSGWYRRFGRFLLRRELTAYRRLGAIDGIAVCYGMPDADALLLSHLDGEVLRRESCAGQVSDYFAQLARLVDLLHSRGYLHLDLGHRRNVLVLRNGRPAIVDFASSLFVARLPLLGRIGRLVDWRSLRRLEHRYGGRDLQ